MTLKIIIAGGGTGGHLFPALAVADELRKRGAEVMFAGTRRGIEARIIPTRKYPIEYIWLSGFSRRRVLTNLLFPLKVMTSLLQSVWILLKFRPQAALGTGGYVCGPVLFGAVLLRIPIFLQEQNSFPGITTRLLAKFAKKVFLNFEEAVSHLSPGLNWQQVGNPVRVGFGDLNRQEAVKFWKLNPDLPTLLVFGGSQGAISINRVITESLPSLSQKCNLIWSRGQQDTSRPIGWEGSGVLVEKPFIEDMSMAYAASDLAVCRSGAMTLSELQAVKLPAILIPYQYAAGDHQRHNAESYCKSGGAEMIQNDDLSEEVLFDHILALLGDSERLNRMCTALSELPESDAAAIIADELLRVSEG